MLQVTAARLQYRIVHCAPSVQRILAAHSHSLAAPLPVGDECFSAALGDTAEHARGLSVDGSAETAKAELPVQEQIIGLVPQIAAKARQLLEW